MARRGHRRTIVLTAAGVLAVAAHLGLGGAVLAGAAWTGWAANVLLAVVLVNVVAVTVHALRRRAIRHSKASTAPEEKWR